MKKRNFDRKVIHITHMSFTSSQVCVSRNSKMAN
jgi:hypothetical protein